MMEVQHASARWRHLTTIIRAYAQFACQNFHHTEVLDIKWLLETKDGKDVIWLAIARPVQARQLQNRPLQARQNAS